MQAGKLRHRVRVLLPKSATDTFGGNAVAFDDGPLVWATIEPLQGKELWTAQQMSAQVTHKVTMRYRAGLTARHRFRFRGRLFEFGPPLNTDERNVELVILATEITTRREGTA